MNIGKAFLRATLAAGLLAGLGACGDNDDAPPPAGSAGVKLHAVTDDGRLISFFSGTPGTLASNVIITGAGLSGSVFPVGMDFRPANKALFLATSDDKLYTLDPVTGVATLVSAGPVAGFALAGLNFNPVPDKIRVVGTANENKRLNTDGTTAGTDSVLAYAVGDSGAGATPSVRGVAYSSGASGTTTAYVIDEARDVLATLGSVSGSPDSPNNGKLFTVGGLGRNHPAFPQHAFDIDAVNGVGYAAFSDGGATTAHLWQISLTTGAATDLGEIRTNPTGGNVPVLALSVDIP